MAAIMVHIYSIDPSYDLTNIGSRSLQDVWIRTLRPEDEAQRIEWYQQELTNGKTTSDDFANILDKTARTYSRGRGYVNLADAEEKKTFIDTVIVPDVGAPFTFVSSSVTDDTELAEKGFITIG